MCTWFVCFLLSRFSHLLLFSSRNEIGKLNEEFIDYQLLSDSVIPQDVWDAATVVIDEETGGKKYRMDVLWQYLSTLKSSDGRDLFRRLSMIAKLVLVIPHSNATEERVFSMVKKNKTPFRPSLGLDTTLAGLLTIKLALEQPCHKFEPDPSVVSRASKVTWEYNKEHMKHK